MTPTQFIPIRIKRPTASDKKRIQKGSSGKTSYTFIFPLSSKPPQGWDKMFRDILDSREGRNDSASGPQAFVYEQEMRVICHLDDVEKYFSDLKAATETANTKYLQFLQQKIEDEEARVRDEDDAKSPEQRAIDRVLDKLDYS